MTSTIILPYVSPQTRHLEDKKPDEPSLLLNAWVVQNIVYELVTNNFLANDPEIMGFPFNQKFSLDRKQSDILVDIAFTWKPEDSMKRPAVFISRTDASYQMLTMNAGRVLTDVKESEDTFTGRAEMNVLVRCVATNIGFTEHLAEYVKQHLLYYQKVIQDDFGFTQFRLKTVGAPQISVESKEHFSVILALYIVFNEGYLIKRDDLKLKTVSTTIFDNITSRPLENQ